MPRKNLNLSMEISTVDYLKRVGNVSRYLELLAGEARQRWQGSIFVLRKNGWSKSQVLTACDVFSGHPWLPGDEEGTALAATLESSTRGKRWRVVLKELRGNDELARALVAVVREYWRHNAELEAQIERL